MEEVILSAGIDIGTTTTQLIFSRLTVQNTGGFGRVPKFEISKKEIIYRSEIYFTPLISEWEIDGPAVKDIINKEYKKAGINPEEVETGAVIITGETSRKRNAKEVLHALSDIAGNFVVETAGPNLEAVLAGKGSGAAALSEKTGKLVANLDIGGGTTNICFLQNGLVIDTACVDIGGRLIKINDGKVTYISEKLRKLLEGAGIDLKIGDTARNEDEESLKKLQHIAEKMVEILEEAVLLRSNTAMLEFMKTNQLITCGRIPDIITLSGGVADCVKRKNSHWFRYGDLGVLLGEAIRNSRAFSDKRYKEEDEEKETVNATVIGAGNFSMEVSGSTIMYRNCSFPLKNVPVIYFDMAEDRLDSLQDEIVKEIRRFQKERAYTGQYALASKGVHCPSFAQLETIAREIALAAGRTGMGIEDTLILILREDIGKALGQALKRELSKECGILCIDNINCTNGDYVDIGKPVASGQVVPVVVKTLIFGNESVDCRMEHGWNEEM